MGTARFSLPFLSPGQAQKEFFHNEALQLIDMLLQPVVSSVGLDQPSGSEIVGSMHIVGRNATGSWFGQSNALAVLTEGGWRFTLPVEQMYVTRGADGVCMRFEDGSWQEGKIGVQSVHVMGKQVVGEQVSAIADPVGGSVRDAEVRQTVGLILNALRQHGLVEG